MSQFVGEKEKFERYFRASFLDESAIACDGYAISEGAPVEYTDAPQTPVQYADPNAFSCPLCGTFLPKDATNCTHCDWVRPAKTETAEGKASDAMAVLLSIIPGLGHIYKGHKLAGFLWMAGAVPAGIFVFLAAIASAGFGAVLFFVYLFAVMIHAYAIDDWVVPPKEDEGEQY